jgi:hypothetical protein
MKTKFALLCCVLFMCATRVKTGVRFVVLELAILGVLKDIQYR